MWGISTFLSKQPFVIILWFICCTHKRPSSTTTQWEFRTALQLHFAHTLLLLAAAAATARTPTVQHTAHKGVMLWGQTGAFSVLSNKERALLQQGCLWSSEGSCGRTRKWRRKTGKMCPVQTAISVLYFRWDVFTLHFVMFFFAPCGYHYDISVPQLLRSILRYVLFLHSNNDFPCVCRLSSSSSFHYKQITSCLLQPEMWKCVTICVPEDFFFLEGC